MISNYEKPTNSLPIIEIITGLKQEKKRLKCEIALRHQNIKQLEDKVNYCKDSIQVLEIKHVAGESSKK